LKNRATLILLRIKNFLRRKFKSNYCRESMIRWIQSWTSLILLSHRGQKIFCLGNRLRVLKTQSKFLRGIIIILPAKSTKMMNLQHSTEKDSKLLSKKFPEERKPRREFLIRVCQSSNHIWDYEKIISIIFLDVIRINDIPPSSLSLLIRD